MTAAERWQEYPQPIEGESDSDYLKRQTEWCNREAALLDAWVAGAQAATGIRALGDIPEPSLFRRFLHRAWQVINFPDSLRGSRG
jgi:hypothetical protein